MTLRTLDRNSNLLRREGVLQRLGTKLDRTSLVRENGILYAAAGVITLDVRFSKPTLIGSGVRDESLAYGKTERPKNVIGGIGNILFPAARMLGVNTCAGYALVGDDFEAAGITQQFQNEYINTWGIIRSKHLSTAVSLIARVTDPDDQSKRRWQGDYYGGGNERFAMNTQFANFFPILAQQNPLLFNLVYVASLLPAMDADLGRVLKQECQLIKEMGIGISADTHAGANPEILRGIMPYVNRLIMNRTEASRITGIPKTDNPKRDLELMTRELASYFPTTADYEPRIVGVTYSGGIALAARCPDTTIEVLVENPFIKIDTPEFDDTGAGDSAKTAVDMDMINNWPDYNDPRFMKSNHLARAGYLAHTTSFLKGLSVNAERVGPYERMVELAVQAKMGNIKTKKDAFAVLA
jgi:sugar/nucleoside kinase (ribokinase family)